MPSIVFSQSNSAGSGYATNTKSVRISYSEVYDIAANRSTVTLTNVELKSPAGLGSVPFFGKVAFNGTVVADFEGYSSTVTASADTFCPVSTSVAYGSVSVAHDAASGAASLSVELRGADSGYQNWFAALYAGGKLFGIRTPVSRSAALTTHPRASTILSCPGSVDTQQELLLSVSRNSDAFYHRAVISAGDRELYTSAAFATTLRLTVPRGWFSHDASLTALDATVSVQTYTDESCAAAVGSPVTTALLIRADENMCPAPGSGWVTLTPQNEGAAESVSGYVKGYSRVKAVFDASKISLADTAGASISSYALSCQGRAVTAAPFKTEVLASAGTVTVVCTVTDSRGRSASESFSMDVMDYEKPTLSAVEVFRCAADGTAAEDGIYYSVRAALSCSPLGGRNSGSLSAAHAAAGGSYGAETALVSGTARVIGTIQADASYTVRLTGRDGLGNEAVYFASIPTRKWAMKFRPNGRGVAFGKAAERDECLELDAGWDIRIGGESIFSRLYPVGSLYLSVNSTSPAVLFGGIWERISDRFLLAAGETYAAGTTGGEAAHTLTEAEMPDHRHEGIYWQSSGQDLRIWGLNKDVTGGHGLVSKYEDGTPNEHHYMWTARAGGGEGHNNMPPYLSIYVWKRTA